MFPTTLITGAAGSGKTQHALDRIAQAIRADPFAPIWVVLPNARQVASFQTRLLAYLSDGGLPDGGQSAVFNVACLSFYQLYGKLLPLTGLPQRRIADITQTRMLRTVIRQLAEKGALTHFAQVASTPGFVQQIAEFIRELKQARITPEHFKSAVRLDQPQDHDLGLIYEHYQATLKERDLVDIEGEGWLALARLTERDRQLPLPVQLLIVDGFDQFNRVQSELLGLLAKYVPQMAITLTYEPERAETAHRRFAQTYHQLTRFVDWQVEPVRARLTNPRPPMLIQLSARLFEPRSDQREPVDSTADQAAPETLTLIEAADPRREVEVALRLIKRALIEGATPESIAIVAHDLSPYRALLIDRAAAYGIPITGEVGTRLIDNPALLSLLAVIDLAAHAFPRRATIDVLRNPYLTFPMFDTEQVDQLDQLSRQQIVIASTYQWLTAIRNYVTLKPDEADDEEATPVPESPFDREALSAALSAFFAQVTPPAAATPHDYATWIEQLIGADPLADVVLDVLAVQPGDTDSVAEAPADPPIAPSTELKSLSLSLVANIRRWGGDPAIAARDLETLVAFKNALADLLAAYDLLGETAPITWDAFRGDLGSLTETTQMRDGALASGQILIGSVFTVRGLPLEAVYVLGLSEGQFPARDPEQTLYLDVERQAINGQLAADGVALNTHAGRADESGLFYELTALAHRRLTLLRSYSAADGTPWPPSIYWSAVQQAVSIEPVHLSMNQLVAIDEAASWSEALTATAYGLSQPLIDSAAFPAAAIAPFGVRSALIDDPAQAACWTHVERSRRIALARLHGDRNEYNGYLKSDLARQAIGTQLAPDHRWSAAQFNDYGTCPYGFFAKRLLNLTPLEEPEPGLNAQVRGTLLHHILEATYRQIAAETLTITSVNQGRALIILAERAAVIYGGAPKRYGFRPDPLWAQAQADLTGELQRLVRHDFSDKSPMAKLLTDERSPVAEEAAFNDAILTGTAGVIIIGGRIDRIDRSSAGLLVIDYKSGSTPFSEADIRGGRAVQTLIYLHVAGQRAAQRTDQQADQHNPGTAQPIHSAYWHTANHKTSGMLHRDQDAELIAEATAALHDRVIAMRDGIFPGQPSKPIDGKCTAYCAFSGLCRVRAR